MLKGQGVWLEADDGRRYLDCYNNVAHVGHAHPRIAEAVARQMRLLNTNTRYLTDQSIAYAEALKATLDPSLDHCDFRQFWAARQTTLPGAWPMSGRVSAAHSAWTSPITASPRQRMPCRLPTTRQANGVSHMMRQLEAPDIYRGPVRELDSGEAYAQFADQAITELGSEGHGLSIAIMDLAFMTNGILDAPAGYVAGVLKRVHAAGSLFIADEVQSGFGRMGSHMWGHQSQGIVPDFVTIGKPAGNGYPIGAIITRAEILEHFVAETGPFFSTFGGGNSACAAGLAVLDCNARGGTARQCETHGRILQKPVAKCIPNS